MMTFLPSLMPSSAMLDEIRVLVAVADDEAAHLVLQRQAGEQFRLAADFEAEIERLARIENFLHHFAQLVHLDRKHAAILALVIEFRDGIAKRQVDGLDAMPQNVLKADEQRKLQPAPLRLLDHVRDVHRRAGILQRLGDDVPGVVDVEIFRAPAMDVVKRARRLDVPRWRRCVSRIAHLEWFKRAHYKKPRAEINQQIEKFLRRPAAENRAWKNSGNIFPSKLPPDEFRDRSNNVVGQASCLSS